MPLHDWATLSGWDGVHQVWMVELLYALKPQLPPAYRAYIGNAIRGEPIDVSLPVVLLGEPGLQGPWVPTVSDDEVAVATISADTALMVERAGRLVAAIELVSPRNKDRLSAQAAYTAAYTGYLLRGVHLLLVDVHRKPSTFSFADRISTDLGLNQPPVPAPYSLGYRVGGPTPNGGRFVAV